jgi:hypothetical protein
VLGGSSIYCFVYADVVDSNAGRGSPIVGRAFDFGCGCIAARPRHPGPDKGVFLKRGYISEFWRFGPMRLGVQPQHPCMHWMNPGASIITKAICHLSSLRLDDGFTPFALLILQPPLHDETENHPPMFPELHHRSNGAPCLAI